MAMDMTAAMPQTDHRGRRLVLKGHVLGGALLAIAVFLGGFVVSEPAPYDLLLVPVIAIWFLFGLKISRSVGLLLVLLAVFNFGGVVAATQSVDFDKVPLYVAVSIFLALSAVFFAAAVSADPERRLATIKNAYVASAIFVALLGIAGYFALIPGSDLFAIYGRARGTFQDPNVFAPFLVLGFAVLFRATISDLSAASTVKACLAAVIALAIFLSFSRAGTALMAFVALSVGVLVLIGERRQLHRMRLIVLFGIAIAAAIIGVIYALSVEDIAVQFEQRFRLLQDYDEGDEGRFHVQRLGFEMAFGKPLGIGPLQLALLVGLDPHNTYLKTLLAYGWLGFAAYGLLTAATLYVGWKQILLNRPWTPFIQCVYAVYVGHVLVQLVIDIDHWRHLYLLIGLLWGAYAAEQRHRAKAKASVASPSVA